MWTEQGEWYGLKPRYAAVLVGRDIASLDRQPELPAGYVRREYGQPSSWKWETGPPLVFLLTILGVAQRSRVRIGDVARDDRRPDVCPCVRMDRAYLLVIDRAPDVGQRPQGIA